MTSILLSQRRRGFTLVELITVILLLVVLILLVVGVGQRVRATSQGSLCIANLKRLAVGVSLYQADHQSRFPQWVTNPDAATEAVRNGGNAQWDRQIMPYLGYINNESSHITTFWRANQTLLDLFYCPASGRRTTLPERSRSYFFSRFIARADPISNSEESPLDRSATTMLAPSRIMMITELGYPAGENMSLNLGGGISNVMYFHSGNFTYLPYQRHSGQVKIVFADGHIESHAPTSASNRRPEGVVLSSRELE